MIFEVKKWHSNQYVIDWSEYDSKGTLEMTKWDLIRLSEKIDALLHPKKKHSAGINPAGEIVLVGPTECSVPPFEIPKIKHPVIILDEKDAK